MPDYKEITITITEGEPVAFVWTNIRRWKGRLERLGAKLVKDGPAGSRYTCPAEWFWPRRKRKATGGRPFLPKQRG